MSQVLRLATAGSVDDGKSTLIGRLLYDSKTIFEDQLAAVEQTSRERGEEQTNLALLTDGLRAEREQGITIDVAYRYFATPRRKFIIADTPGHVQHTRNMVTGASTADVALVLVDARKGVVEQSRRHAFLATLLGIPHVVVCVNKMDLVDWSRERFNEIREEFERFALKLNVPDLTFIPLCALNGDNLVHRSARMPWYEGVPLLHYLEEIHIASDRNLIDVRFPVQYVIQHRDFRGYAGTVVGGVMRPGDDVVVLPSGFTSTVESIRGPGGKPVSEAFSPQSVTISLTDELDVSRGDMLCRPDNQPNTGRDVDAMVCWLTEEATLEPGSRYTLLHTTSASKAHVRSLNYRFDINTLHRDKDARSLGLNEIGRIRVHTQQPLLFDSYRRNRQTGSFVLVDDVTHNTVAAGMIIGPSVSAQRGAQRVVWHSGPVTRQDRGVEGATVWLTGLSGSGKSTIACELERRLVAAGRPAYVLDGDNLRHGLNSDLGFSADDRAENVRRVGEVARLFADAGVVAIVSLISPFRADRERVRAAHADVGLRMLEVFVDTPLDVCEERDPKGFYARARTGEMASFTGIDSPYEQPESPDLVVRPDDGTASELAGVIQELLES